MKILLIGHICVEDKFFDQMMVDDIFEKYLCDINVNRMLTKL